MCEIFLAILACEMQYLIQIPTAKLQPVVRAAIGKERRKIIEQQMISTLVAKSLIPMKKNNYQMTLTFWSLILMIKNNC